MESNSGPCSQNKDYNPLNGGHFGYFNLVFCIRTGGVSNPGYERDNRQWQSHSQIGYHFTDIVESKGNDTVEDTKNYNENMCYKVALGHKYQGTGAK